MIAVRRARAGRIELPVRVVEAADAGSGRTRLLLRVGSDESGDVRRAGPAELADDEDLGRRRGGGQRGQRLLEGRTERGHVLGVGAVAADVVVDGLDVDGPPVCELSPPRFRRVPGYGRQTA